MTSCQTWTSSSHIRHPWFDTPIMKRKHPETVSPDDDRLELGLPLSSAASASAGAARPPPPKRRRCTTLENGFAHLTLGTTTTSPPPLLPPVVAAPQIFPTVHEIQMSSGDVDADMPLASTSTSTQSNLPYTIEEPRAPEVKMRTSSWYEPEPNRIIITDMDSFAAEDEEDEDGPLTVNPVFLDRIRSNTRESSSSKPPAPSSASQALVLFKPLALGDKEADIARIQEEERRKQAEGEQRQREAITKEGVIDDDDDAMDVEP